MEKIPFSFGDTDESVDFYVLEATTLRGTSYLLVTEEETGDAPCYILKDNSGEDEKESLYEIVEDDVELAVVSKVFEELLEDVSIEQ